MRSWKLISISIAAAFLVSCASVDITKTSKEFYDPTDANRIEILKTRPQKAYEELGDITAANFLLNQTAVMHNEIRNKAAGLGAHAVILTSEGVSDSKKWAIGTAVRFK